MHFACLLPVEIILEAKFSFNGSSCEASEMGRPIVSAQDQTNSWPKVIVLFEFTDSEPAGHSEAKSDI